MILTMLPALPNWEVMRSACQCEGQMSTTIVSRRHLMTGGSSLLLASSGLQSPAYAFLDNPTFNTTVNVSLQWPKFAAALAGGVLSSVAISVVGKVLFGGGQDVDLSALIREFAAVVEKVVQQQIKINDREKLEARAKGLQDLFRYYMNAPEDQQLTLLVRDTVLGVREAERLGVFGMASYGIIGSLVLASLQEKYLKTRADGARKNIVVAARQLVDGVPAFSKALRADTEKRFSRIHGGGLGFVLMDGNNRLRVGVPNEKAVAQRHRYIEDAYEESRRKLLDGLDERGELG